MRTTAEITITIVQVINMKTVNLNEILEKNGIFLFENSGKKSIISAMREACEQTIELCAENHKLKGYTYSHGIERNIVDLGEEVCVDDKCTNYISTDKQSILNTKTQIV